MLEFREIDYNCDIPEVVDLIRENLDKRYNEKFFRWKHLENPFGKSYGLVATDEGRIIGLRLFMFWEFYDPVLKKSIKSIRPVDTVIEKNYQGKGLFKKLTMQGLEDCQENYQLIYNTPNFQSLPGYLKMGWNKRKDNIYFALAIINPFVKGIKLNFKEGGFDHIIARKNLSTYLTPAFINWRYPLNQYKKVYFEDNIVIFEKKKFNKIPVFIIYEMIGEEDKLKRILGQLFRNTLIPLVYFLNAEYSSLGFIKVFQRKKAIITFKRDLHDVQNEIKFSLGDLEGKI